MGIRTSMNPDRLQALIAVHDEFCTAASLPESVRPYSTQSRLEDVQKLIMEELSTPKNDDKDKAPF